MKRKVQASVARGILSRVPSQRSFWLCTNQNLRSIADVSKALQVANDEVFRYHVNRDKNDFEAWIRDIVKDKDLAREIARVKTRETLIRKISERVEALRGIVKKGSPAPNGKKRHTSKRPRHRKKATRARRTTRRSHRSTRRRHQR